jgi:hypothetical protein
MKPGHFTCLCAELLCKSAARGFPQPRIRDASDCLFSRCFSITCFMSSDNQAVRSLNDLQQLMTRLVPTLEWQVCDDYSAVVSWIDGNSRNLALSSACHYCILLSSNTVQVTGNVHWAAEFRRLSAGTIHTNDTYLYLIEQVHLLTVRYENERLLLLSSATKIDE